MATVDITNGTGFAENDGKKQFVIEVTLNFATTTQTAADVLQSLNIPADTLVQDCFYEVLTAEGGTLALDIGDGDDPNGYHAAVDANAAGSLIKSAGAYAQQTLGGRVYTAADTIDVIPSANADAGKVRIVAICIDLS